MNDFALVTTVFLVWVFGAGVMYGLCSFLWRRGIFGKVRIERDLKKTLKDYEGKYGEKTPVVSENTGKTLSRQIPVLKGSPYRKTYHEDGGI